jgi:DNA replication protein
MRSFNGFSDGKIRFTPLPGQFFSELLPEIDHLGELKLTLYAFWRLDRTEGAFRWLQRSDFTEDTLFMKGMAKQASDPEAALDEALERAVGRGSLLKIVLSSEAGESVYFFLNSPKGRAAVEAVRKGQWNPAEDPRTPVELSLERPNIFRLYEEHVGPLTPLLAESLREAETTYPSIWFEDAFRIAVENNKRSWKYIEAILRRWQESGRDEQNRRDSEKDRRRYAEWESG